MDKKKFYKELNKNSEKFVADAGFGTRNFKSLGQPNVKQSYDYSNIITRIAFSVPRSYVNELANILFHLHVRQGEYGKHLLGNCDWLKQQVRSALQTDVRYVSDFNIRIPVFFLNNKVTDAFTWIKNEINSSTKSHQHKNSKDSKICSHFKHQCRLAYYNPYCLINLGLHANFILGITIIPINTYAHKMPKIIPNKHPTQISHLINSYLNKRL